MNIASFHPPYRAARRMNPGAALLAGLLTVAGIEALAAQALARTREAQAAAIVPANKPRATLHADAGALAACDRQPPFCTPFHCN